MALASAARLSQATPEPSGLSLGRLGDLIGFRLRRVQNQLSRDFSAATASLGLRSGLFSALAIIEANPGLSQSALSREISLDKSVTVAIVDDLESFGWALRTRSQTDRRRHALNITEAGTAQLDSLLAQMAQTEAKVRDQLSAAELLLLHNLLDRMYAACAPGGD